VKHFVFIVNPRSGTDRAKRIEAMVGRAFEGTGYTHEIRLTEHARHGTELAREAAAAGAYAVVAVGGDGSVADVAQGLLRTGTALGIVPKGSGNGLARALRIPLKTEAAIALLVRAEERTIDVGFAGEKLFLSNAGVGFDTVVSQAFQTSVRRGLKSYAGLVAKHLWAYRPMTYRITLDGEQVIEERAFLLTVANGSQLGYNFRIAPAALLDDGLLDVVIVRPFPHLLGCLISVRAWTGSILKSRYVRHYTAREVHIYHPDLSIMQTDGDPQVCAANLVIRLEERAMRVLAPAS
jgi:YegS/Rv2252/BmrU family lipid kinase